LIMRADAPEAATLKGNRELLSQALANLVDNAIKYAGPKSAGHEPDAPAADGAVPAEIVLAVRREGGRVRITVSDRGPGIPEAERVRVLERFVRLSQSIAQPGSGLGLSLAAAVARLHGGELTLEDNAPGLRVVINLPAA
jgi:signal transduction histidine kinase